MADEHDCGEDWARWNADAAAEGAGAGEGVDAADGSDDSLGRVIIIIIIRLSYV